MKPVQSQSCVRQQGAATLVVVMMLFLVMALLAAYANRSMLFEQRIASSYARAALSQEVAEGGIEWTLAQLNGPAVDGDCKPKATGGQRFVDKYLQLNPVDRSIAPARTNVFMADCTRDLPSEGWTCRCPAAGTRTRPTAVGSSDVTPSFGVLLKGSGSRGGTLNLEMWGCTDSVIDNCRNATTAVSQGQQAATVLSVTIALASAVRNPPAAPLVVKGDLGMTGTGLGLHNTDPRSAGSLLAIGGDLSGLNADRMQSVPGTSPAQVLIQPDLTLKNAPADDVFKMFMGAASKRYENHPSLRTVTCNGDCAQTLQEAYAAGKRILLVKGPLTISSNKTLGSLSDPVLIIATDVTLEGPFQINGMLVSQGDLSWTNTGGLVSLVNGMVLVTGSMLTTGSMDIAYQQAIADQLRNRMGSYVRVPGGWTDN